jgi:hypothetical protein
MGEDDGVAAAGGNRVRGGRAAAAGRGYASKSGVGEDAAAVMRPRRASLARCPPLGAEEVYKIPLVPIPYFRYKPSRIYKFRFAAPFSCPLDGPPPAAGHA